MAVGLNCLLLFLDASLSAGCTALSHASSSLVCPAQACPDTPFFTALVWPLASWGWMQVFAENFLLHVHTTQLS